MPHSLLLALQKARDKFFEDLDLNYARAFLSVIISSSPHFRVFAQSQVASFSGGGYRRRLCVLPEKNTLKRAFCLPIEGEVLDYIFLSSVFILFRSLEPFSAKCQNFDEHRKTKNCQNKRVRFELDWSYNYLV